MGPLLFIALVEIYVLQNYIPEPLISTYVSINKIDMKGKMTNKEDDGEPVGNPRIAALLAVHLVSQVLEEAYVIANASLESGQPWNYQSMLKHKSDKLCETDDEDTTFEASKGDSDVNENKIEDGANIVATSTPQKVTDNYLLLKPESSFIGQGDEEYDLQQDESTNSTSMFINHLFDLSEVEKVVICDESEIIRGIPENSDTIPETVTKIVDNVTDGMTDNVPIQIEPSAKSFSTEHSEYSFLTDAFVTDVGRDVAFYIQDDDDLGDIQYNCGDSHVVPKVQIAELCDDDTEGLDEQNAVARFEHYLTLNRDYEQCSDDGADPILEDPRGMTLQEVELLTANTSEENIVSSNQEPELQEKDKPKTVTETLTATTLDGGLKKTSLVGRCRSQGAKFLASLRGWWRRRIPGKRKENQIPVMARGLCPLSPDARRRAASLLDQRLLRSPTSTREVIWKFNTVNEAVVHSSHWKEYTFDENPEILNDCGER